MKKLMMLGNSSRMRRCQFRLGSLLLCSIALVFTAAAQDTPAVPSAPAVQEARVVQPSTDRFDVALSGFGQVTASTNSNSIREDTTESLGGLLSFRESYRPWVGYEVNYGYTRFSESYGKGVTRADDGVSELTFNYLFQLKNTYYHVQPFVTLGGGIIAFQPSSTSGSQIPLDSQLLPVFDYALGLNYPQILSSRFGLRVQYRALEYKTPDFHDVLLDTHSLRTTMEPSIGVFYRF